MAAVISTPTTWPVGPTIRAAGRESHAERIPGPGKRGDRRLGNGLEPCVLVLENAREGATRVEVESLIGVRRDLLVLLPDLRSQHLNVESFDGANNSTAQRRRFNHSKSLLPSARTCAERPA